MAGITRKTAKIFASGAGGTGVAVPGSVAAGSVAYSTDVATLQSTAFENGLADMIIAGTKRLPVYEEINAVEFVLSTQIAYLLERGIPEYDSGTSYNATDVVRKTGTYELYGSVGNSNLGNALPAAVTDANWTYLGTLANLAGGITSLTGDVTGSGTGAVATTIANNAVTLAKLATQAANTVLANGTASTAVPTALALANSTVLARSASGNVVGHTLAGGLVASGGVLSGFVAQRVSTETGAVATGTTVIPLDDTIPQNTEGDQYMTLAITPKSATSILVIESVVNLSGAASNSTNIASLFQDSVAGALATSATFNSNLFTAQIKITHIMTSGSTSPITFKIRAGQAAAGTTTFNGASSARLFGGVNASSMAITEYAS